MAWIDLIRVPPAREKRVYTGLYEPAPLPRRTATWGVIFSESQMGLPGCWLEVPDLAEP